MPPQQIVEMATSGRLILPKNFNSVTRDLVKRILVADPELRIDIKGIMQHRFFADVNWAQVSSKLVDPPYVPPTQTTASEQTGPTTPNGNEFDGVYNAALEAQFYKMQESVEHKVGSSISSKSSPSTIKRTLPNKILGDFHLTKINQIFHDF